MASRRSLVLILACTATLAAGCESPMPPPVELGIPWALAEHRKATLSQVEYRIELDIPEARHEEIRGRTLVTFQWDDPDAFDVVLDFQNPAERMSSVYANGDSVAWRVVEDHVVIPASALTPGYNEVTLWYRAGDGSLNRNDDFLYALFVPDRAHFSLPVFDQPNLKATVQWVLTVPGAWEAVANGPLFEVAGTPERKTLEFGASKPLPTYLFAFAAGRFQTEEGVVDGRVMRMFHRETDTAKVERNKGEIFRLHAAALDWLEEYTGIPYPFQKFDFALIPSFQYGGMEHPGAIFYSASGLILDESATQGQILGRASLIAHETAHMWFGDLVTMNWFDDVWTKEVFANFMAAKIVHPSFPEVDHDLRFLMAHHPSAYGVDRTPGANAIRQPLENLREAGTLYGAIIYQKAPIVMRHLEARVGEDTFREGIREYLSVHAYGNATWPDLIAILDRLSPSDLTAWSRVWVEEPGRPTITVARTGAGATLTPSDPAGKGRVWPQTLDVRSGNGDRSSMGRVEMGADPVTLQLQGDPAFILPNGSGMEYALFVLDDRSRDWLVEHLPELDSGLERGTAWVTLWDQVLEGRLPPADFLALALRALPREGDELNLSRILGYLGTTYWDLLPAEERAARAQEVEDVLWDGAAGNRPATARATFFGAWRSMALTPGAVARMERLWRGTETRPGIPLSENDQPALATGLALREVPGWAAILDEQEERITNPDRKARFAFVRPSLDADPQVRLGFFASLVDPANREREPWVLAGLGNLHHPLRGESALGTLRPALDMIEEIQRTGDIFFPGRWLDANLGGHNQVEAAETILRFLEARPDLPPRLRGKVLQSADGVWRGARLVHGWEGATPGA